MGGAGGAGGAGVGAGEEEVVSAGPGTVGRGARGVSVSVWSAAGARVVVEKVVGRRAAVSLGQRAARSKSIANISSSFVARGRGNALQSGGLVLRAGFYGSGL